MSGNPTEAPLVRRAADDNTAAPTASERARAAAARAAAAAGAAADTAAAKVEAESMALKSYANMEWGNPWYTVLVAFIITLVVVYWIYTTEYPLFDATGVIGSSNPGTFGNYHGALLYLVILLSVLGAAGAVGVMFPKMTDGVVWAFGLALILALFYYFAINAIGDQAKISFWAWLIISALAPIVVAFIAWLMLRSAVNSPVNKKTETPFLDEAEKKERNGKVLTVSDRYQSRMTPMYVMLGDTVIFAIVSAVGLYLISSNVTLS
jgi:hypothetical protein